MKRYGIKYIKNGKEYYDFLSGESLEKVIARTIILISKASKYIASEYIGVTYFEITEQM